MRLLLVALAVVAAVVSLGPVAAAVTSTVDSNTKYTSIVIGPDGYPIVAYYNPSEGLKVADCADSACQKANTTVTFVDEAQDGFVSMVLDTDGNPVIIFSADDTRHLRMVKCGNTRCNPELATFTTVRSAWTPWAEVALKDDGLPFIVAASHDANSNEATYAIDCLNEACTSKTQSKLFSYFAEGLDVEIGHDGYGVISHHQPEYRRLIRCGDQECTAGAATTTIFDDLIYSSGGSTSLAIKANGNPTVAYRASSSGDAWIRLADCTDVDCSTVSFTNLDTINSSSNWGEFVDLQLGPDGHPIVAYYRSTDGWFMLADCDNSDCTSNTTSNIAQYQGLFGTLAISPAGDAVMAYQGRSFELKVTDTGPLTGPDGSISGYITDEFANPTPLGRAEVYTDTEFIGVFSADSNGHYDTGGLSAGTYYVFLYNGDDEVFWDWFPEWYPDIPHILWDDAKPIVITHLGGPVEDVSAQLEPLFLDMFDTVFGNDIFWLRGTGITVGCSLYLFCTDNPVDRGSMAAFLVRGLGYKDDGGGNLFIDTAGSIFANDIDKLATAGVTKGCNPPTNDKFCPNDLVTRGQMAAFLVRAMGYTDNGGGDLFTDDDASTFENDIDKLATAGVTKGCNPPTNDKFCPNDVVTRGQMAAFLHRALGGGVIYPLSTGMGGPPRPEVERGFGSS